LRNFTSVTDVRDDPLAIVHRYRTYQSLSLYSHLLI